MQRGFWQAIASDWDDQIFDTLAQDRANVVSDAVRSLAISARTVADFGCGVGRCLPLLATNFRKVIAFDWATACVKKARLRAARFSNVEVLRTSTSVLSAYRGSCDATFAVQVAIHPDRKGRERALSDAVSLTKKGGRLLIVVPSLESVLYADSVRRMFRPRLKSEFDFRGGQIYGDPGVLSIGGQPTKHYVAEEILLLLKRFGCEPEEPRRVEYSWRIYEVGAPPRYSSPSPWDWLVVARRL